MAPKRNDITVAVIGLVGLLGAALIANWKSIFNGRTHDLSYRAHVVTFDRVSHNPVPLSNASVSVSRPVGLPGARTRNDGVFEIHWKSDQDHQPIEFTVSHPDCDPLAVTGMLTEEGEDNELSLSRRSEPPPDAGHGLSADQQTQLVQLATGMLVQSIRLSFSIVSGGRREYMDYSYGLSHHGSPKQFAWELRPGKHNDLRGYWIFQAGNLNRAWRCVNKNGPLETITSPPEDEELFLFEIVKLQAGVVRARNVHGKYIRFDKDRLKFRCDVDEPNAAELEVHFD
jgi:hypothetical protein